MLNDRLECAQRIGKFLAEPCWAANIAVAGVAHIRLVKFVLFRRGTIDAPTDSTAKQKALGFRGQLAPFQRHSL